MIAALILVQITKDETKKFVSLGDFAVFSTKFDNFGMGLIKGKALDDRVGCAILIEVLKKSLTVTFMESLMFKKK